jgi:hypothetical protein
METYVHNVFVSYHHIEPDQTYRNDFENYFATHHEVMVSKSVQIGEIDPNLQTDTVRQKIRDEYLRAATVTIVLIGEHTWQRKHVDWEISSSIRDTQKNPRSGLLGIFLPSFPFSADRKFNPKIIPPRLYDNWKDEKKRFAELYYWTDDPIKLQGWIQKAFENRNKIIPDNSYPHFVNNRTSKEW